MEKIPLSVVILTKNVEETLIDTLKSVDFADEILAIDDGSTDGTLQILEQFKTKVVPFPHADFAAKRTKALSLTRNDWIFYVDADEVVTPELTQKVIEIVQANLPAAYSVKRRNIFLGTEMYPDYVDRLFHASVLQGWQGKVHESPVLRIKPRVVDACLFHYTHRDITSMLTKTNTWSEYEAELRLTAHHPPMAWWRLLRIGLTIWWQQFIVRGIYSYGRAGLFEGYFQIIDKLIVYTKLWERQQKVKQ